MATLKCKMCGGDLQIAEGMTVAECEYCGTKQTVPNVDNEKKLTLFGRANRLRMACDFDKAAGVYESIVAEFPEEAEAYWGLVLCRYGIEYVDDPATGKKIPTCHRSSFDSVMEDKDFEQALENADIVAQKVYREEAKEFERIRKGILEVSSSEKPYDIFICYKETDEKGDRTLDSVLAQDLYSALTDKGYRVFFSRITLQGKLGEAYEPYIFAALNSAKVMLAVGTCFEYYNAVWVKNEWSRYIKLCEADKSKHLIPCYKDLDPEDMPKEFNHLQGADLGKMGAVQDILFNMEKYIPLKKQTVIQEKVVVGGVSGDNKIASLLDRGNMALEDGDWAKADSFFEDVLNNDSKNAQAYIGKTLAREQCRTLDALVRKRKDATQNSRSETLSLEPDTVHMEEAAQKYSLSGYVEPDSIRKLYDFDLSYSSDVPGRKQQYQAEENWWTNHKHLSRAEKFAAGDVAQTLQNVKKQLFAHLADRVKSAEQAETAAIARVKNTYAGHIARADSRAEKLYQDGLARREADYQNWLEMAKAETSPESLMDLASKFDGLGNYQDSKNLAQHCRKRSAEEQAKLDAEAERQRILQEKLAREKAAKNKKMGIIAGIVAVIAIAAVVVVTQVVIPSNKYQAAEDLLAAGQYEEAVAAFEAMGSYKDAQERIPEVYYTQAEKLLAAGQYQEAVNAFEAARDYQDAQERVPEVYYAQAEKLLADGKKAEAALAFGAVSDYLDAKQRSTEVWSTIAVRDTLVAGSDHTVALKSDGTVVAVGDNEYGQCDVSDWTDIVAISAGWEHTAGLKSDGTVVAVGDNEYGQCDVSVWTDIVAISAGEAHTIGLKSDGTVVAVGNHNAGQCDVGGWTDIVAVSAGGHYTVGLKSDGTVVAVGFNKYGQCDVSDWTDIKLPNA